MSNYYKSKCCKVPADIAPQNLFFCPKCRQICEVTAMIDTPCGIPTDTSYIGGVNFDPDIKTLEERLATQKAEIISLIMGMETKDKGRESDEFDQGMEIMRAKIINKIRETIR